MGQTRCINCMEPVEEGMAACPHCGYQQESELSPFGIKPNTILKGRYLVGRILGQGGFGITYVGCDLTLNVKVAIKEYFPMGCATRNCTISNQIQWNTTQFSREQWQQGSENFLKEARRMAMLESLSGIVRVKDTFPENQTAYIVMEYIEGETLKQRLQRTGTMQIQECIKLLTPLMESLEKMHQKGLVHRDISPDNIMLRLDGSACLLDFGAAKDLSYQQSIASQQVAKKGFSPPEQYREKGNIGSWTDVYALCATIYYCVTGKLVPDATDRLYEDTLTFDMPMPEPFSESVISALRDGLKLRSEERIQTVESLLERLEGAEAVSEEKDTKTDDTGSSDTAVADEKNGHSVIPQEIHEEVQDSSEAQQSNKEKPETAAQTKKRKVNKKIVGVATAVVLLGIVGITLKLTSGSEENRRAVADNILMREGDGDYQQNTAQTTGGDTAADSGAAEGQVINIYSFNEELKNRITAVYSEIESTSEDGTTSTLKDGRIIRWVINPNLDGEYQDKLDEALMKQLTAADDDKIDIFAAEIDYVVKYTDADIDASMTLASLGINPDTDLADQYDFTKTVVSDQNGDQRASTWQACPGVLVYRRDIAQDVFGTDDPEEIGKKTKDWATMKETAEELKAKGYYTFACCDDTFRTYSNNMSEAWVTFEHPTTVKVDQKLLDWVADSKEWKDAGYFDPAVKGQWNADWFSSMGSSSKVFAYLFPAWGIDTQINPNWDGAEGSWAVTNAPLSYNWGGTYILAAEGTDNPSYVKDIILALTGNTENLTTISTEYGEFTNAKSVMDTAAQNDDFASDFLGGQNPFGYFSDSLRNIKMVPLSAYDQGCVELIQNTFHDYLTEQVDYDTAKENFEIAIKERYPEITEVQWPE